MCYMRLYITVKHRKCLAYLCASSVFCIRLSFVHYQSIVYVMVCLTMGIGERGICYLVLYIVVKHRKCLAYLGALSVFCIRPTFVHYQSIVYVMVCLTMGIGKREICYLVLYIVVKHRKYLAYLCASSVYR